ncbi:MAG: NAD(P)H-dependent oxidoreductase [Verrucomicrobiota bacterium]
MTTELISNSRIIETLKWRYATKALDPTREIPDDHWETLLESIVLAPTSFGLQPFRVYNVENAQVRAEILPHAWNQKQITDASKLLVFAGMTTIDATFVDAHISRVAANRNATVEAMARSEPILAGLVPHEEFKPMALQWSARQAYIALGCLLFAAALLGIDACPMVGFIPPDVNKVLGLTPETGFLGGRVMCVRLSTSR